MLCYPQPTLDNTPGGDLSKISGVKLGSSCLATKLYESFRKDKN